MNIKKSWCLVVIVGIALCASEAVAASTRLVLCKERTTGAIKVKTRCTAKEIKITSADLVGLQGPQGNPGDRGPSAFETLPSGTTVRGVIGAGNSASSAFLWTTASLPAPAPQPFSNSDVLIALDPVLTTACPVLSHCLDSTQLAKNNSSCTGTADLPTAPAGKICIYPRVWIQLTAAEAAIVGASGDTSLYGFGVQWDNSAGSALGASWAYTAP